VSRIVRRDAEHNGRICRAWAARRSDGDAKRPTQIPAFDQAQGTLRQQLQTLALQKAATDFTATQIRGASIQQ